MVIRDDVSRYSCKVCTVDKSTVKMNLKRIELENNTSVVGLESSYAMWSVTFKKKNFAIPVVDILINKNQESVLNTVLAVKVKRA